MERVTLGLLGLDGLNVNANCSDPHSFRGSPFGPCWGDGWERESSESRETSLRGADRRLSFTFAIGTNGGTWPLELHLFEYLAHVGSAVSSLANPSQNTFFFFVCYDCENYWPFIYFQELLSITVLPFVWQHILFFTATAVTSSTLPQFLMHIFNSCISENRWIIHDDKHWT